MQNDSNVSLPTQDSCSPLSQPASSAAPTFTEANNITNQTKNFAAHRAPNHRIHPFQSPQLFRLNLNFFPPSCRGAHSGASPLDACGTAAAQRQAPASWPLERALRSPWRAGDGSHLRLLRPGSADCCHQGMNARRYSDSVTLVKLTPGIAAYFGIND